MKCSMHTGKTYSIKHNERDYDKDKWNNDGHIDYSRSELNQTYISQPLYDFFDEQFGAALIEYNERSRAKHPERLIGFSSAQDYDECPAEEKRQRAVKAYYQEQKGKVQEVIIQLGSHEDYCALVADVGQDNADSFHANYLTAAYERWRQENPTLVPFCAVSHLDEVKDGTPHLHIDYLPIADSSKGLTRKVSMDGALKQLGYKRDKQHKYAETPYRQWLRSYRASQEQAAQEFADLYDYGLEIEPSEPSKAKHEQPQDYKLRQAEQQRKQVEQQCKQAEQKINEIANSGDFPEGVYQPTGIISKKATMPLDTAEQMRSAANAAPYMQKRALKAEKQNSSLKDENERLTAELNETKEELRRANERIESQKRNLQSYDRVLDELYVKYDYDDDEGELITSVLHELQDNQYFYANREPIANIKEKEPFNQDLFGELYQRGLRIKYDYNVEGYFCLTEQKDKVQALIEDYKASFVLIPPTMRQSVEDFCRKNKIPNKYKETALQSGELTGVVCIPQKDNGKVKAFVDSQSRPKMPYIQDGHQSRGSRGRGLSL